MHSSWPIRYGVLGAALLVGFAACRGSAGPAFAGAALLVPSSDAEAAHDELLRADLLRADSSALRGIADGLASSFADNVLYLRGGLPILRGRLAARAVISAEPQLSATTARWQPVRAETSLDRKHGFTYGYTILSSTSEGTPTIRVDRYIAYWRREDITKPWLIAAYAETYGSPPATVALPDEFSTAVQVDVPMSRMKTTLDALRAADEDFSRDANRYGPGEAFGRYAAENAQMFSAPGEFLTGPDAIAQSFGAREAKSSFVWHPVEADIAKSGDLGFTVGNAVFTVEREDGVKTVRYSKYLTIWKKQKDGSWRFVVDGGSARPGK